jgi:H+/Cl- antiporter ClcA
MKVKQSKSNKNFVSQNLDIFSIIGLTLLAWSVPFVSMIFTGEMLWDEIDFIVSGLLVGGAGVIYVVLTRLLKDFKHKWLIGVVIALIVVLLWIELAVGLFTHWGS